MPDVHRSDIAKDGEGASDLHHPLVRYFRVKEQVQSGFQYPVGIDVDGEFIVVADDVVTCRRHPADRLRHTYLPAYGGHLRRLVYIAPPNSTPQLCIERPYQNGRHQIRRIFKPHGRQFCIFPCSECLIGVRQHVIDVQDRDHSTDLNNLSSHSLILVGSSNQYSSRSGMRSCTTIDLSVFWSTGPLTIR